MKFRVLKVKDGEYLLQYKYWFKWRTAAYQITFKETNKYFDDVKIKVPVCFSSIGEAQSFATQLLRKNKDQGSVVGEFSI